MGLPLNNMDLVYPGLSLRGREPGISSSEALAYFQTKIEEKLNQKKPLALSLPTTCCIYPAIIPLALMGYWLRGHEGERNKNCFSKIQLVGQKC